MCGIVGYVGRQEAAPILLDGLERLEYRGYDSAGIAVCGDGVLRLCKKKGRVAALRELTHDGGDLPGTLGIGHTRWATHGEPNDVNAHPHMSQSGKFAVVHNGIIENFITLKEELQQKGYVFQSETDTEVVAQLLDYYYSDCGDFFEAMNRLLHAVDGAYALGIICADYPDRLVAARKDAPLLLGFGDGENFIASDVTALIRHTRDIAYMDDGELAILSRSGIRVYDRQLRPVEKKHHHVDWEVDAAEKGGYAHFMLKEIMEQPAAIRKATAARIQGGRVVLQDLTMTPEQIRAMGRIYIVACGSSYHVGMVGKYNLERMLRRSVEVCLASEFRYADPIVGEGDLVIVISQSGETLDTMAALREAKKRGARILSIVNVVGSSIARESDDVLYTWAGPEIAVATTKAYSTQMAVLNLLGLYFGEVMGTVDYETYTAMVRDILALPEKLERVLARMGEILDGARIDELPIPFTAVATDLGARREVWFTSGPVDVAIRASVAMPGVITPIMVNGRLLVDGGVLNPVPVDAVAAVDADFTMAISLSGWTPREFHSTPAKTSSEASPPAEWLDHFLRSAAGIFENEWVASVLARFTRPADPRPLTVEQPFEPAPPGLGIPEVASLALDTMGSMITRYRIAAQPPDLLVTVPGDAARTMDFHRAQELIDLGRELTITALDDAFGEPEAKPSDRELTS